MRTFLTFVSLAAALSGCGDSKTHDVDWYKKHDVERTSVISSCSNSPGTLAISPNCVNAKQAEVQLANSRRGWLNPATTKTQGQ